MNLEVSWRKFRGRHLGQINVGQEAGGKVSNEEGNWEEKREKEGGKDSVPDHYLLGGGNMQTLQD